MKRLLPALVLTLIAITAVSNPIIPPPINGIYFSNDLPEGAFNTGYFSESWVDPGTHGQIGNTVNAASWNGTVLGAEWRFWCTSIDVPPQLVDDTRDENGTGEVTWRTHYGAGNFWLSEEGPWSFDNSIDFTGLITSFTTRTTYQYVADVVTGIRSNITAEGLFDNLGGNWTPECVEYTISNAAFFGTTEDGPRPNEFPPFLDPAACPGDDPGLTRGGWGSVTQITLTIRDCGIIPTESASWGKVKSFYRTETP